MDSIMTSAENASLQRIFTLAPCGLAELGPNGRFLRANAALVRLLGYDREALLALSCCDIAAENEQLLLVTAFGALIVGERDAWTGDVRCQHQGGATLRLRISLVAARAAAGAFERTIAQFDECPTPQAEEMSFRELFEQAPYGIALYTPEGWQRRCNAAFFTLFGLPPGQPLPHHLPTDPQLLAAGHGPLLARAFAGELVGIPPIRYSTAGLPGADESPPRWVGSVIFPLRDARGQIREVAVVFSDVTEQYRAEEALRASNERLEARVAERTRELTTLLDITREVAATLELEPLLGLILDRLAGLVTATMLAITVLDGDELVQVEYRGPGTRENAVGRRFPIDQGSTLWRAFQHGRPVTITDVLDDTEMAVDLLRSFARSQPAVPTITRSWLGVPLMGKGETIGMLALAHIAPDHFTASDARLVAAFAAQAAVAVENARLYEQAQSLAVLEERQRLARELHDSVSQALYGIALGARTARTLLERDPARCRSARLRPHPRGGGLTEMRALIFELRPESLATEGRGAALGKLAEAIRARHRLIVDLDLCDELAAPLSAKEALYRIAQEATNNAIKHARAGRLTIGLVGDEAGYRLVVRDDGSASIRAATSPATSA